MKYVKNITLCLMLALLAVSLLGCGGGGADEDTPMDQVKAEAAKMDAAKLEAMVKKYTDALAAKQGDIDAIAAKIKEIPLTEIMGDKSKALKADMDKLAKSLKALGDRMEVYKNELAKK